MIIPEMKNINFTVNFSPLISVFGYKRRDSSGKTIVTQPPGESMARMTFLILLITSSSLSFH